jgi:RNA polymerase sigma factor (sigma-70 family)
VSPTEILVENHRAFLSFLERRVGDRATAEDILQDAFVRSVEHGGELREDESAVAWFYRVLRNAIVDHHRRGGASERSLAALARELEDASEPPRDLVEAACACVGRLAKELKAEYAQALQRVEVEGASLAELAAEAGITAGNAAVRLHRARLALRREVTASCGTCAEHGCVDCTCGGPG